MILMNLISWWYGRGVKTRMKDLGTMLSKTADTFSIGLMLKTLFNPFRQIDANASGKGIGGMFEAFISNLVSRFVGFFMRLFMIIAGIVILTLQLVWSGIVLIFHITTPLLPLIGIILMATGLVLNLPFFGDGNV